jgi:hypothetical protein
MYRAAGVSGIDPLGHSLRHLLIAAREHQARQWDHTAALLALTANANSGKNRRYRVEQFHPMMAGKKRRPSDAEHALCFRAMRKMYSKKDA